MADFEWDEEKAKENLEKHGIDFADAVTAFEDTMALLCPILGRRRKSSS